MKGKDNTKILDFYFDKQKKIHISCDSGRFYNGTILEINFDKKFILFIDNVLGELPVMFEEIINVEPMREKGDRK